MAQDPYGNEIVDPFDQAIADGVMKSTWQSSIVSVVLAFTSGCCFGVGQLVSPTAAMVIVSLIAVLALTASANVILRVFTMQPEHKRLVPGWAPWAALGVALIGGGIAGLQLFVIVGSFVLAAALGG